MKYANLIARHVKKSPKTQAQISKEAGFKRPNVVSLIKAGRMGLPIPRVPALAKAIECDPRTLLLMVLKQDHPGIWQVIGNRFPQLS